MSSSLTDEQSAAVRQWAEEGADLAAIQKRLDEEFEVRLTFMDTRFLIADLGIELAPEEEEEQNEPAAEEPETPVEPEPVPQEAAVGDEVAGDDSLADSAAPDDSAEDESASAVVTISEVERPGVMISGTVTFDGGEKAEWYLDPMGQLGFNPDTPEFRPSPAQMRAFQTELQKAAQEKGL